MSTNALTNLNFKVHTIIMLVGPTSSGKTHFCDNFLIPGLKNSIPLNKKINIQYLSSDAIRREVLGDTTLEKYADAMSFASEQAFNVFYKKLEAITSYPINAEFVILDTTGLAEEYRKRVLSIAQANHYKVDVVVFGFKDRKEFFRHVENPNNTIIHDHIKKLNTQVLKTLNKRDYNNVYKLRTKDFDQYNVAIENLDEYFSHHLEKDCEYIIIGDVHGCLVELKELLIKNSFVIDADGIIAAPTYKRKIILVGDYIDKGPDSKGVVDFLYRNKEHFILVLGNHENYVYKHFKGTLVESSPIPEDMKKEYLNTVYDFEGDSEILRKLSFLVESAKNFYKGDNFIVTHSPCLNKFLGKIDSKSLRNQRYIKVTRSNEFSDKESYVKKLEEDLAFLKEESRYNLPYHIFGHIAFLNVLKIKNKISIDTGCECGSKLTSVVVNPNGSIFYNTVMSKNLKPATTILDIFKTSEAKEGFVDLEPAERFRIKKLIENKVNFISGTMAPSGSLQEENDIESLKLCLDYYKYKGVNEVILQIKYMGSRCNIYLFKDIAMCFAVSRNGYTVKTVDLTEVYKTLLAEHLPKMESEKIKLMILDGELLPWYAMGKGLIESEYNVVSAGIASEIKELKSSNFEERLASLKEGFYSTDFEKDVSNLPKKDLITKYTDSVYSTYQAYLDFRKDEFPLAEHERLHAIYQEQLANYGRDGDITFKAFAPLKFVYEDGREELFFNRKNSEIFEKVSKDEYLVLNLSDDTSLQKATDFFNKVVAANQEGLVVKPNDAVYIKDVAPYMKVRNKNYLSIIYGYDFLNETKYKKLMSQKRIKRKLEVSIKEFDLGKKMLETPWESIALGNSQYFNLIARMIFEERRERELDPRL